MGGSAICDRRLKVGRDEGEWLCGLKARNVAEVGGSGLTGGVGRSMLRG